MKKYFNQKGFTLVEILVVIAIIAILFVVLIPQIDNAVQKSRVSNVRNDMRGYQQMTHSFLLNTRGDVEDVDKYNAFLDQKLWFDPVTWETTTPDAWGTPYTLTAIGKKMVIKSSGPDETLDTKDDIVLAMYVNRDYVDVCTLGFAPNDIALKSFKLPADSVCGDDIAN